MGHTCNSVVINAPYDLIFDISNDIPRWTELFGTEYKKAEIVKRKVTKLLLSLPTTKINPGSHGGYYLKINILLMPKEKSRSSLLNI